MSRLRGVAIGAGYFSQFHFDGWSRIDEVDLVAICDLNEQAATNAAQKYGVPNTYANVSQMLDEEKPDFVDIITRPDSHLSLVRQAADRGIPVICQKALAPTFAEAKEIVDVAQSSNVPMMVHASPAEISRSRRSTHPSKSPAENDSVQPETM